MGKKLIIVESPAKAKTIVKFLGPGYAVKASMGHIRDLPKKELGIDVENNFKPKYVLDRKKSSLIKELKSAAKDASEILLASDRDREGEAIAWHLKEALKKEIKNKPVHRIVFNEITKKAIRDSIKHPTVVDENIFNSQQARRILDRIVGYKVSPLLWKVIAKNLSAGRVQSVALRLICEREEKIEAFKPEEYWSIDATIFKDDFTPLQAELTKIADKKAEIKSKEESDKIISELNKLNFIIDKIEKKSRKIQPYPPYITSTLQQDASKLLNFSPKFTMQIAQKLYEGINLGGETVGLISYMRTDSLRLSDEAHESSRKLIAERYGKDFLNKTIRVFKNKNKSQDAHEAIRPTDAFRTPESISQYLDEPQKKLYTLIWQRFIATQMIPASIETNNILTSAGKYSFKSSASRILNKGFLNAYPHVQISEKALLDSRYSEKDILEAQNIKGKQHFTKPPARYSEASLIKEMESLGIGRPSTYASITNTIRERDYVRIENKYFHPTDLGKTVNAFLVGNFSSFFNVNFTAEMEDNLDKIGFGELEWHNVLKIYFDKIMELLNKVDIKSSKEKLVEETDLVCEKCGSKMVIKWGRNGKFLACSNYPECKNIKNFKKDENGKIIVEEPETLEEKCPKCGNPLVVKTGRYGKFIACSNYPKCKFTKPLTTGIKCPKCGKGELVEKRNKKGKTFYGCSNYPECNFISNFKPIIMKCTECDSEYLEEHSSKEKGKFYKCPKCGKEYF